MNAPGRGWGWGGGKGGFLARAYFQPLAPGLFA